MNAVPFSTPQPLLDVLGARWKPGVPVLEVAWDEARGVAGFALGDGSLAIAPAAWDGAPELRARENGSVELRPASRAAPAVARIPVHAGACLGIAADPDGGFLSGGDDGQLARVQSDGTIDVLARYVGAWSAPLAAGAGGWRVCASGRTIRRIGAAPRAMELAAPAEVLAVAPDGSRVAIGHSGGVTLWAGGETPRVLQAAGTHRALAWSGDMRWLASATVDSIVRVWSLATGQTVPLPGDTGGVRSLGFAADGTLVAGGVMRVLAWPLTADLVPSEQTPCGVGGQSPVTRVACHPRRALVAAGYRNGAVVLCRPGSREILLVRGAEDGAIAALAWSADGETLAIGTDAGEIAMVRLPALLFRAGEANAA